MMSSAHLTRIFEQALSQKNSSSAAYIYDAPIHYIVLTKEDNQVDLAFIKRYTEILDEIEATEGPGVVLTIGVGKRHFSTGFDMTKFLEDPDNYYRSNDEFKNLLDRVLRFPLPTMCVFRGNSMAAGLFLGLAHDFRIMSNKRGKVCFNELAFGGFLPPPLMSLMKAKLKPAVANKMQYAVFLNT